MRSEGTEDLEGGGNDSLNYSMVCPQSFASCVALVLESMLCSEGIPGCRNLYTHEGFDLGCKTRNYYYYSTNVTEREP